MLHCHDGGSPGSRCSTVLQVHVFAVQDSLTIRNLAHKGSPLHSPATEDLSTTLTLNGLSSTGRKPHEGAITGASAVTAVSPTIS